MGGTEEKEGIAHGVDGEMERLSSGDGQRCAGAKGRDRGDNGGAEGRVRRVDGQAEGKDRDVAGRAEGKDRDTNAEAAEMGR